MREPGFRLWDTKRKTMIYVDDSVVLNNREVIPMLYSQVIDDKSHRIYEGDIITLSYVNNPIAWYVFFSQGAFWCKPIKGEKETTETLNHLSRIYHTYVIGNVWETPKYHDLAGDTRAERYLRGE